MPEGETPEGETPEGQGALAGSPGGDGGEQDALDLEYSDDQAALTPMSAAG